MALGKIRKEEEKKESIQKYKKEYVEKKPVIAGKKASAVKEGLNSTINPLNKNSYCRYCQQLLPLSQFSQCTHPLIDKNGRMSICNSCIKIIFDNYFNFFQDKIKAMFSTCEDIDWRFDESTASATISYMNDNPSSSFNLMSKYKREISRKFKEAGQRFRDTVAQPTSFVSTEEIKKDRERELFLRWGEFKDERVYDYLEHQYSIFKNTYNIVDPSVEEAFKTMSILLWRQRVDPTNKDVVSLLEKQMKLCGVSPEAIKKESQEQGRRTLGLDIATMEQTEPAEYIKEHNLYYDYDKIGRDLEDIKRAMKNILIDSSDSYEYGVNKVEDDIENVKELENENEKPVLNT